MVSITMKEPLNIMNLFEEKKLVKICAPMVRYNDTPLVVQFAANTIHDFVGASNIVSPYCNGVDLNCGCPQRWAKQMGIGCALLEQPELIADLVTQCRNRIAKPFTVSIKLRISKDTRKTVEICRRLEKAGVSYLSVHARTPSQHAGVIDTDALKLVVENVNCPVVSNGGIKNLQDCYDLQNTTNCKGVMVANGLLTNPTLFSGAGQTTTKCVQKWVDICYNSTLDTSTVKESLSNEDSEEIGLCIPERPPNLTFQCFHHHLVFMLEKILPRSKRIVFNNLRKFKDVLLFLNEYFGISPQIYHFNTFKNYKILDIDYSDRDDVYMNLKPNADCSVLTSYNFDNNDGKFFKSKLVDNSNEEYSLEN